MTENIWEIAGALMGLGIFRWVMFAFLGFDPFVIHIHKGTGDDE